MLHELNIRSTAQECLVDITGEIARVVRESGVTAGTALLYIPHTTCALTIQENADPDVLRDLNDFFCRIVPEEIRHYRHTQEGADDMPAHIRAALTTTQLSIPVRGGEPDLGRWQGIFLFEHRTRGRERRITAHLIGE